MLPLYKLFNWKLALTLLLVIIVPLSGCLSGGSASADTTTDMTNTDGWFVITPVNENNVSSSAVILDSTSDGLQQIDALQEGLEKASEFGGKSSYNATEEERDSFVNATKHAPKTSEYGVNIRYKDELYQVAIRALT